MLCGIYLSSTEQDNMGNLTMYPGSHLLLERFFREKGGVIKFLEGTTFEGIKLVVDSLQDKMPPPVQIHAKPGEFSFLLFWNIFALLFDMLRQSSFFHKNCLC